MRRVLCERDSKMVRRSPTTKDIGLLHQLYKEGQLELAAEFQRNSVWPRVAKAYLIDTILSNRPIPLLFFQRATSAQTSRPVYVVIDGQQRLRAVFEFLDDRLRLTAGDKTKPYHNKCFSELRRQHQEQILQYDLTIEELSGYSEKDIRDMFVRMNKYVVKLSPQEIRHARETGAFCDFVEKLGKLKYWRKHRVFTPRQIDRFRAVEFSAELIILLVEGPQDKKSAIDLYYREYQKTCPFRKTVESRLVAYLDWIARAVCDLAKTRFRKPVDLYAFVGALKEVSRDGKRLPRMTPREVTKRLTRFDRETQSNRLTGPAAKYVAAASRQTDNIRPRTTRIDIISTILCETYG